MRVERDVLCSTLLLLGVVYCGVLPLEKCKLEDSNCMTEQFQKSVPLFVAGIPDAGVEVLDAMNMSGVNFDISGLQFTLNEGQLQGLKSTVIENVKWNTKKKHFTIEYHMDGVVKGHYTAAGRLLILPITGDGQMTLKLKNVHIKFHINYEMVNDGNDGKKYVHPTKYNFEFDVKGLAHYHLTNLFNGNKELSDAMLIFLNENWKQITAEFGKPVMEVVAKKIFMNIKSFLEKEPIEDIAEL